MSLPLQSLSPSPLSVRHPDVMHNSLHLPSRISLRNLKQTFQSQSYSSKIQSWTPIFINSWIRVSSRNNLGLGFRRNAEFSVRAEIEEAGSQSSGELEAAEARGESTMPARFRYLSKEVPEPSVRWPWFFALAFLVYAWRAVLFELSNWRKAITNLIGYPLKLILALIFHFIGDPVTSFIRGIETAIYTVQSLSTSIIANAPLPELATIIILSSTILAIGETVAPTSAKSQPYLLTLSGIIGYMAVSGVISELFFWILLIGIYSFSRFFKKRDDIMAILPVAAVLAAIGEPWVRVIVIGSYLALAISHYWKKNNEGKKEVWIMNMGGTDLPLPLVGAALAIGIRVAAAKWAGY